MFAQETVAIVYIQSCKVNDIALWGRDLKFIKTLLHSDHHGRHFVRALIYMKEKNKRKFEDFKTQYLFVFLSEHP